MSAGFPALLNALRLIKFVGIWLRKGLGIGLMMGVLVGFLGKPVGISGVSEDLSTVFEKDMMDVEKCWRGCRCLQTEYQSAQKVLVIDACSDSRCDSVMQGV